MPKLLAVSDEPDPSLTYERVRAMEPNLVISCGDLRPDYLDFISSAANAPLLYVPGNHDPDHRGNPADGEFITNTPPAPPGVNLDGAIVTDHGLRFVGLGGSIRYRPGANQYSQRRMGRRVSRLIRGERLRGLGRLRPVDVFVAHSPPYRVGDGDDPAHQGFEAFHRLIEVMRPRFMLHGHIHPHGFSRPDRQIGETTIINVIPHRVLEVT